MLLGGERIRWPCWRWRIHTLGYRPGRTPGSQPRAEPRRSAGPGSSTSRRRLCGTASTRRESLSWPFPGVSQDTKASLTAGRGGSDPTRGRPGGGACSRRLRDLPTSTVLHATRSSRTRGTKTTYEECSSWRPGAKRADVAMWE